MDGKFYATFRRFNEDHPPQWFTKDIACPYGGPGDTIWVRENWYVGRGYDDIKPKHLPRPNDLGHVIRLGFMADGDKPDWAGRTRPSIHLPRWLCRIRLTIVEVGVQRLRAIDEQSAKREGVPMSAPLLGRSQEPYKEAFQRTWIKLNGQESWDLNPWVWVIKFTLQTP